MGDLFFSGFPTRPPARVPTPEATAPCQVIVYLAEPGIVAIRIDTFCFGFHAPTMVAADRPCLHFILLFSES